jgi:hypothetical protein
VIGDMMARGVLPRAGANTANFRLRRFFAFTKLQPWCGKIGLVRVCRM